MSLTPAVEIRFDGVGLAPDDDHVVDAQGIHHFHKVKAGSTWEFRIKNTGVSTPSLAWRMHVRRSIAQADPPTLGTEETGAAAIVVATDPDSNDVEVVQFTVTGEGTKLLQTGGAGDNFVFDIIVTESGRSDVWYKGSGQTEPVVTR